MGFWQEFWWLLTRRPFDYDPPTTNDSDNDNSYESNTQTINIWALLPIILLVLAVIVLGFVI